MIFPTPGEVFAALQGVRSSLREGDFIDVRLQVYPNPSTSLLGNWALRSGDPGYDLDHHGYWGESLIEQCDNDEALFTVARDLLEQVDEHYQSTIDWER